MQATQVCHALGHVASLVIDKAGLSIAGSRQAVSARDSGKQKKVNGAKDSISRQEIAVSVRSEAKTLDHPSLQGDDVHVVDHGHVPGNRSLHLRRHPV